ncbi:cupin domain-containing protein [Deinococcus peraridilitoris]|uniref:Cupin domain-containing protein n=1 Tax=Deinococcus peraridilitoris (strain DSM 19664 / LMG 22246 / CIP 109416 / KR-200) TaxID=937777 RepID=L0A029_DEIPD|nr:cupin domain-containing protein [Deinococcus peraridilitoris]AFZ67238.1 cupin domain-containing protein [Deinococcus peraridilitoris DSM 19664]
MLTADLNQLDNYRVWFDRNPDALIASSFPIHSAVGARSTAVVYMEFDPDFLLERHTDSAEEIVLVLEGTLQGTIGNEQAELTTGQLVVIPAMVPHSFHNTSNTTARAVGFFSSATVISTFDSPVQPISRRVLVTPTSAEEPDPALA